MTDPAALIEVLRRWQEAVAAGREPTPEELCPRQPELHRALWLALAALRGVHNVDPDAVSFDAEPAEIVGTVIYRGDSNPKLPAAGVAPPAYQILGEICRSEIRIVYRARQIQLGRDVALKVLLAGEPASFHTEAEILARMAHPHIAQLFELGEFEGHPYMALEPCPGGSLEQLLADRPLPPRTAAEMVHALAGAVQHVHDRGFLHRDLHPGGILLTAEGQPRLADFSLARLLDRSPPAVASPVLGIPNYTAPEQVHASPDIGPACDVYALGAILHACLTGRPPFHAATATETLLQVVEHQPVPVRQLQPGVPADLETICLKCLSKEPVQRYASAQALADDLDNFLADRPITARLAGALERAWRWVRRNPGVTILTLALAVAVGLLLLRLADGK